MSFPSSPSNGQTALLNGIAYLYNSTTQAWTRLPQNKITVSSSPPSNTAPGNQWYDTTTDILFTYINDGSSTYWLDSSSASIYNTSSLNVAANGIITGNLAVGSGVNTPTTSTTTGTLVITGGVGISADVTIGGNLIPSSNANPTSSNNIGSTSAWWNNIYGTAIHANYADLAEKYISDKNYDPGTVVVFGGEKEITTTSMVPTSDLS